MNFNTLDKLPLNKTAIIEYDECDKNLRKRIYDMGIIKGEKITPVFKSPFGNPIAFLVKDTIIALRKKDCEKIYIKSALGG